MNALAAIGVASALWALFDEERPHLLTARELRAALRARPTAPWAWAVVAEELNLDAANLPDDLTPDEARANLREHQALELATWRAQRPRTPRQLAPHRLNDDEEP